MGSLMHPHPWVPSATTWALWSRSTGPALGALAPDSDTSTLATQSGGAGEEGPVFPDAGLEVASGPELSSDLGSCGPAQMSPSSVDPQPEMVTNNSAWSWRLVGA